MSSKHAQPDCEALLDNAASADSRFSELTNSPIMALTRSYKVWEEATYAAGALKNALLSFIPPQLLGSEALSELYSEMGPPTMVSKDSLMVESKSLLA